MPAPAAEPPIGYEAARASNVRQLRAEHDANLRAEKLARGLPLSDEDKDRPAGPWAAISSGINIALGIGLLFAKDADGLFPHGLRARWVGPLAARFIQAHAGQLRPGRGLQVQLHHLHCARDELCARISNAQLAPLPPSWLNAQEHEPTHTD